MAIESYESPFRTEIGRKIHLELLNDGPVAQIFLDPKLRLGAAKGGSDPRFRAYHDQSHFQHALNVGTAGGLLFEAGLLKLGEIPREDEMRIVLAAGALHDFNKITSAQYPMCLETHSSRLTQLIGTFGGRELDDSIRHLLLAAEEGMDPEASRYPCLLEGQVLLLAKGALTAADTLVTAGRDLPTWQAITYRRQVDHLRRKYPLLPEIHVIGLNAVPQGALEHVVRASIIEWVRSSGALLHDSPRMISWVGDGWSPAVQERVSSIARERVNPPFEEMVQQLKVHSGSGSIATDWVNRYPPTPERIIALVDAKSSQLIFWGGDWGANQLAKLNRLAPCFQLAKKTTGEPTAKLVLPESDADAVNGAARRQALIILANCLRHNVTADTSTTHPNPEIWAFDSVEGKSKKFIAGIIEVVEKEPTPELLKATLEECVSALANLADPQFDDGFNEVIERMMGTETQLSPPGQTGRACVLCGTATTTELKAQSAFGLKPSGWLPRSASIQGQQKDSNICPPCALDSTQRAQVVLQTGVKGANDAIYLHVHKSDVAVDGRFLELMRAVNPKRAGTEKSGTIFLYARGKEDEPSVRLDNHTSVPIPSPSTGEDQFRLLEQSLVLVHDTGHKVQLTGLGGIPRLSAEAFDWQNAPSWVRNLRPQHGTWQSGFEAIRIDRIQRALTILKAIRKAAFVNKTGKTPPYVKLATILATRPIGLYRYPCQASRDEDETHPTSILENEFMDDKTIHILETAARAYCSFNTRESSAWGKNNHWQWATRSAIRGLERRDPLQSRATRGRLHNEALRKNEYAKAEDIETFVSSVEDLMTLHADNEQIGRDLIAAIEWTAERLYHAEFSVKARTKETPQ